MKLDPQSSYKPMDFGNGLTTGSVNDQGRLVSINTFHPQHGYVTLNSMPPFSEDRRYEPTFVREYRAELAARGSASFGFAFRDSSRHAGLCSLEAGMMPRVQMTVDQDIEVDLITFAPYVDGAPTAGAVQLCSIVNGRDESYELSYHWAGLLTLTRAGYAQLTEGGPLPRPADEYLQMQDGDTLVISNVGIEWSVVILGVPAGGLRRHDRGRGADILASGTLQLGRAETVRLVLVYGFGRDPHEARAQATTLADRDVDDLYNQTLEHWNAVNGLVPDLRRADLTWTVGQAVRYTLACCAVPVHGTTCLITDHQILPLAWTRDAYYQVHALLTLRSWGNVTGSDVARFKTQIDEIARQHLLWLFEVAERPEGYWGRSYLTTGKVKDPAFQLDQQCYPLLELAQHVRTTGDMAIADRVRHHITPLIARLLERRAPDAWLFPTGETPADDPVTYPYHLSSQILLWRTFGALAELNSQMPFTTLDLAGIAERVRRDVYRYMVVAEEGRSLFCYLADLRGSYSLYHDANDLPTALAPKWGFCSPDDPVWRATVAFAFSVDNRGGFYAGPYGGLGSVHTPHAWTLGDIQELLIAQTLGDRARQEAVESKLVRVACWDGLLCEAYDEMTGQVASRHWFAWPGAALTMAVLDAVWTEASGGS